MAQYLILQTLKSQDAHDHIINMVTTTDFENRSAPDRKVCEQFGFHDARGRLQITGCLKAQRGHSMEKRTDCPLLTLDLVLYGSGFIRRSEVFAGNVHEAGTLMLGALDAPQDALVEVLAYMPDQRGKDYPARQDVNDPFNDSLAIDTMLDPDADAHAIAFKSLLRAHQRLRRASIKMRRLTP